MFGVVVVSVGGSSRGEGGAAAQAAPGSGGGFVRVAAHHLDDAGDVFLVPALAVDVVGVPVVGEEPADHSAQVLITGRMAAGTRGVDARVDRRAVRAAAGALAVAPYAAQRPLEFG